MQSDELSNDQLCSRSIIDGLIVSCLCALQVLEFDLKGSVLDSSAYIDIVVKDYETIGKDK